MKKIHIIILTLLLPVINAFAKGNDNDEKNALSKWKAGAVVTPNTITTYGLEHCFMVEPVSDMVFQRINGKSYHQNPHIQCSDLRYLKVLHYDGNGQIKLGELICNKAIAQDLLTIFRELYDNHYPIERMQLIDDFDANDEKSMRANNTSCFCYRTISNSTKISKHALGLAVDINPLYNPYYRRYRNGRVKIQPSNAARYSDRKKQFAYKIDSNDLCYKLFIKHGFQWGGAWTSLKDYQHFEK